LVAVAVEDIDCAVFLTKKPWRAADEFDDLASKAWVSSSNRRRAAS